MKRTGNLKLVFEGKWNERTRWSVGRPQCSWLLGQRFYVYPMKCSSVTTFLASSGYDDIMQLWKN